MFVRIFMVLELKVDPTTGRPISEIPTVPEQYRRFIQHEGYYLLNYLPTETNGYSADPYEFLVAYPDYDNNDEWSLEDHEAFRQALEWFDEHTNYMVHWIYVNKF